MLLTDAELDALVMHLRAQRPSDDLLSSVLKKAETSRTQRKSAHTGFLGRKQSAEALRKLAEASETPINRFFNPGTPTGYSPPRRVKEGSILKTPLGASVDTTDPEEVLRVLGL